MVQAEDEIAAIGNVLGASWAGARDDRDERSRHLAHGRVLRLRLLRRDSAVVWDIQRVGPSTGLPTRTMRATCRSPGLSHGDTSFRCCCRARSPSSFEFAGTAFDLAERLQTPLLVLSDLDLGMNNG